MLGFTQLGLEPTNYHTQGEHANHNGEVSLHFTVDHIQCTEIN